MISDLSDDYLFHSDQILISIWNLQENDTESLVNDIFDKWNECHTAPKKEVTQKEPEVDIAELLKTQTNISLQASSHRSRQLTEEEKRIKQQILASYSQVQKDNEEDDEAVSEEEDDPDLEKNTNKSDVQKLAREKRDQAKLESDQKKLKDKEDRAKQKATREEKKTKRQNATTKGERKR